MFNFIAKSILKFAEAHDIEFVGKRKLGFTFSFPIKQTSVVTGILANWTKGFSATGVVNKDVVSLLSASLKRYGIDKLKVVALANDTVGTLAAGAIKDPKCDVGVIFGTGTNACYREKTSKIKKLGRSHKKKQHMIVNIEWGNFNKLPTNIYDSRLDKATNNPGQQKMEKMISGMYLGEITRLVLTDLIKQRYIFVNSKAKFPKGSFGTRHMSLIESDHSRNLTKIGNFLESQSVHNTTIAERNLLQEISAMVSTRAARVSAAAISAVIEWMDPKISKHHTVAIDGTLYERHPGFSKMISSTLKEIHGNKSSNIKLARAKDGSGIGVAIIAAVAHHRKN
jgi:hexokinase